MSTETKCKIQKRLGRKYLVCRYKLPGQRWKEESTKKTRRREAESVAKKIVAKAERRGVLEIKGWAEFRARYESEHLSGSPKKTLEAFQTAANRLESLCNPETVDDLNADMFSRFALRLRSEMLSPSTIKAYRDHLMSSLKWAVEVGVLATKPKPPQLPGNLATTKSRGRPITREELERIAMKLPEVVGAEYAKRWAWNLEALWRSGFRLGETLLFHWEFQPGMHYVDNIDGDRPRIVIDESGEKAHQNRRLPMAPDFVALLRNVPANRRHGRVFRWPLSRGETESEKTIGKRISECGRLAQVATGTRIKREADKPPEVVTQYATAHDIRKAFGDRWSVEVPELVLMIMMRHSSIETTRKHYTNQNSDRYADALWKVQGAVLGDMLDSLVCFDLDQTLEKPMKHCKK